MDMEETDKKPKKRGPTMKGKEVEIVKEVEVKPKKVAPKLPERKLPKMTFDSWWMQAQKKHNFDSSLKEVVFKHFRARGFLSNGKFEEGLRDFGLKS